MPVTKVRLSCRKEILVTGCEIWAWLYAYIIYNFAAELVVWGISRLVVWGYSPSSIDFFPKLLNDQTTNLLNDQ